MAKRRRRKERRALQLPAYSRVLAAIGLLFIALFIVLLNTSDDRSWQEYIDAGDRAYKRGNYAWAEKMYREALQYAEQSDKDGPLVAKTWRHLRRLEQTRSRSTP